MADQFEFKLVSPEQVLQTSSQAHVILPDHESGQMGIMPGHAPTIAQLGLGVIIINPDSDNPSENASFIFITGGFADIAPNHCTIMAEVATPVAGLDRQALSEEVESLKKAMAKTSSLNERAPYKKSLKIARAKIDAIDAYHQLASPMSSGQNQSEAS